jgi:hypothetical protein
MVVYPFAYIALTLPLASGRVAAMAGNEPPLAFFPVAGTLMACCGITDVLLCIWTRKALLKSNVGIKVFADPENGITRPATMDSRRKSMGGDAVRLSRLTKVDTTTAHFPDFDLEKEGIVVPKSVMTMRSEDSLGLGGDEGNGSDRSDSFKSLVVKKDFSKDWLR